MNDETISNTLNNMKKSLQDDYENLSAFLNRWPLQVVEDMKISDYVDIRNDNTFCRWVEGHTRQLGSINGVPSTKFGIYRMTVPKPKKQLLINGDYAWYKKYGDTQDEAFEKIKTLIIEIIKAAIRDDLDAIDKIDINSIFKWKVAFLYSNNGFIPIFEKGSLVKIAYKLGMSNPSPHKLSNIHRYIRGTHDGDSPYEYMRDLFTQYIWISNSNNNKGHRKSVPSKNTSPILKQTLEQQVLVNQYHNEIQLKLYDQLKLKYGKNNVHMEKDFIDIYVELPDKLLLYEVKSDPMPRKCVRQAIGQLLSYAQKISIDKTIELIIFGNNPPNNEDKIFIQYFNSVITMDLRYEHF